MHKKYFLFLAAILVTACSNLSVSAEVMHSNSGEQEAEASDQNEHTGSGEPEIVEATPAPEFTPTPDLRMPPSQWQNWPIIPEATNRTKDIYQKGLELGVNPYSFSKIGDCQNVKESFMGIYDLDRYLLQEWQRDWQDSIDNFQGYFNRDGKAFGQGLNVAAALSPFHADPEICQPDESPLQCELRVANPSFAFIRFERWWEETPPDVYENYLRQIMDEVIAQGTVPILMTKADNIEGEHKINLIIAKLAFEYDIPLFNWWRAAQSLPNKGLDPTLNDGFHLDPEYAWTEQSVYALGSLDSVWKGSRE